MKNIRISMFSIAIAMVLLFTFRTICSSEETHDRIITIDENEITVFIGESYAFKPTVTPIIETARKKTTLEWSTSDKTVASVNSEGRINGKSKGDAVITCMAKDDHNIATSITVHVVVPASKITVNQSKLTLELSKTNENASAKLHAEILPEDAFSHDVEWVSSNENVATVDTDGNVTAVAPGNAKITASPANNSRLKTVKAYCTVTVVQKVTEIIPEQSEIIVGKGKTVTLKPTVMPANANLKTMEWVSSNSDIAKVQSNGSVTGKACGTCEITCTAKDGSGCSTVYRITVVQAATSLTVQEKTLMLQREQTYAIKYDIKPNDVTTKTLRWESSDLSVATVSENGVVCGISGGDCVITCTTVDGSNKSASVKVHVPTIKAQSSLTISTKDEKDYRGLQPVTFSVTYYGNGTVEVKPSSNKYYTSTIQKTGKSSYEVSITPKRAGNTTIKLVDTNSTKDTVSVNLDIRSSAVYQEVKKGEWVDLKGEWICVKSVQFVNSYSYEYWYNSRRGRRLTHNAQSGETYLFIKYDYQNSTGRTITSCKMLAPSVVNPQRSSSMLDGILFWPDDYNSLVRESYAVFDDVRISNGTEMKMSGMISLPASLKNSKDDISIYFDANNDGTFEGVMFFREQKGQ